MSPAKPCAAVADARFRLPPPAPPPAGVLPAQGWRKNMEDEHIAVTGLGGNGEMHLFGVFDGHGGKEVARFCGRHMAEEFVGLEEYRSQRYDYALKRVFHRIDEMLEEDGNMAELEDLKRHPLFPSEEERREMESKASSGVAGEGEGPKGEGLSQQELLKMLRGLLINGPGPKEDTDASDGDGDGAKDGATPKPTLARLESVGDGDVAAAEAEAAEVGAAAGVADAKAEESSTSAVDLGPLPQYPIDSGVPDESEEEFFTPEMRTCNLEDHAVRAGCTSVVALMVGDQLYVANAGDSRGVLCRGGSAVALSFDHKPKKRREFERITAAEGFVNRVGRVNGNLNLSRSIGDLKYKQRKDMPREAQIITAEPDVSVVTLRPGDEFFVLACDGIWDCMTNQQCVDFVRARLGKAAKISDVCEEMLQFCIAEDPKKTNGIGGDNMSVVIVKLNT